MSDSYFDPLFLNNVYSLLYLTSEGAKKKDAVNKLKNDSK